MPLSFQCPSCQMKLRIAEENRGKQVRCPKCTTVLRVPGTASAPEPPPVRSAPPKNRPAVVAAKKPPVNENIQEDRNPSRRPADRPRPKRDNKPNKSKDRSWLIAGIAVACGGGILCLALGIGLIVWLVKKSPNESQTVQNNVPAFEQAAQPPGGRAMLPPAPPAAPQPEPPAAQRGPAILPAAPPPDPPANQPIVHVPQGPTPAQLDAATLRKVKQATVYLRVELPNGSAAEGSGFLCAAPRIVITNAHVLGMLRGDRRRRRASMSFCTAAKPVRRKLPPPSWVWIGPTIWPCCVCRRTWRLCRSRCPWTRRTSSLRRKRSTFSVFPSALSWARTLPSANRRCRRYAATIPAR